MKGGFIASSAPTMEGPVRPEVKYSKKILSSFNGVHGPVPSVAEKRLD